MGELIFVILTTWIIGATLLHIQDKSKSILDCMGLIMSWIFNEFNSKTIQEVTEHCFYIANIDSLGSGFENVLEKVFNDVMFYTFTDSNDLNCYVYSYTYTDVKQKTNILKLEKRLRDKLINYMRIDNIDFQLIVNSTDEFIEIKIPFNQKGLNMIEEEDKYRRKNKKN